MLLYIPGFCIRVRIDCIPDIYTVAIYTSLVGFLKYKVNPFEIKL